MTGHRVELYVRSLRPDGYTDKQTDILDRIDGLVERGTLTDREIQLCGCQVPTTPDETTTEVGERIVTRLAAFQKWATVNGCSLSPAFERRAVEDSLAGVHYRAIRMPAILLAEYHGDRLTCVTPHCEGETVRSVADRVEALEAGEPPQFDTVADGPATEDQTGLTGR